MATVERVTWVCDLCGDTIPEGQVEAHVVAVDGRAVAVDFCGGCWGPTWDVLSGVLSNGRPSRTRGRRRAVA